MALCLLRILLIWAAAAACGCAGAVTTVDGRRLPLVSPEFRDYVEQVFREQNRLATRLAFALEEAGDDDARDLAAAEEHLLDACAGLNRLAAARRDGQRLGPKQQADAARDAPRCESAITAARVALERAAGPRRSLR